MAVGAAVAATVVVAFKDQISETLDRALDKLKEVAQKVKDKITLGTGYGSDQLPPRPEPVDDVP